MFKRFVLVFGGTLLLMGSIAGIKYKQNAQDAERKANFSPPLASVSAVKVEQATWRPEVASVGTLSALEGIELSVETSGTVDGVYFDNGLKVTKGDLLLTLNDDVEQAELIKFKAQARLESTKFKRSEGLYHQKNISETAFDQAKADLEVANANVIRTQARIDKKNITAPFSGNIGIRKFSIGQYLESGNSLVSLQDISALRIDFSVPGRFLPNLYVGQDMLFKVSAFPDKEFHGFVTAINAKVDEETRNIAVQAQAENIGHQLRPGMYADIRVLMKESFSPVIVPSVAISYSPFGDAVFTVSEDEDGQWIAQRTYIEVGEQRGDMVAITQGLKSGERVVNAGSSKLENGSRVILTDTVKL